TTARRWSAMCSSADGERRSRSRRRTPAARWTSRSTRPSGATSTATPWCPSSSRPCSSRRVSLSRADRLVLADALVGVGRNGGHVLVDVVHATAARLRLGVLDRGGDRPPLDRLDLVVDRAVRAVAGQRVLHERAG